VRCRQPEQILFPSELTVLLPEPVEISALLAGEQALVAGTALAAIDTGLAHPARQAAGREAMPLSHGIEREALLQAELHGLGLLLRRGPAPGSGGVGHRWTVWWPWRDPYRLVLKTGGTPEPLISLMIELNASCFGFS